ncbi:MAG: hypothetical protein WD534_11910 [Phycisphaeraceae bacterium]
MNLTVPAELAERFETICKTYGHGKQKGVVLSAAILMYLGADPQKQGEMLREVIKSDISQGVDRMIERARANNASTTKRITPDGSRQPKRKKK